MSATGVRGTAEGAEEVEEEDEEGKNVYTVGAGYIEWRRVDICAVTRGENILRPGMSSHEG